MAEILVQFGDNQDAWKVARDILSLNNQGKMKRRRLITDVRHEEGTNNLVVTIADTEGARGLVVAALGQLGMIVNNSE